MKILAAILTTALLFQFAGCKKAPAAVESQRNTTPKDAFLALLRAMQQADTEKIFAVCKVTPEQKPIIAAGSDYSREVYKFRDAFIAKYGQEAWDNFEDPAHRPGDFDCTFIIIDDEALERAGKSPIDVNGDQATCLMPSGQGKIKLVRNPADGTWMADGSTFVPPGKTPAELQKTLESLTAVVRKYEKAIGKPGISPSDIDYEIGREINELISGVKEESRHRFEIDKL